MKNRRPATQSLWLGLALSLACAVPVGAQTFEVVHSFIKDDPQAGSAPIDLVKGDGATLYGATLLGGPSCRWTGYCGVVFAMESTTNPRPIHDLGWSYDKPDVRLSWSNTGQLYVTTGSWSAGQILRLTPTVDGPWNVERLPSFPHRRPGLHGRPVSSGAGASRGRWKAVRHDLERRQPPRPMEGVSIRHGLPPLAGWDRIRAPPLVHEQRLADQRHHVGGNGGVPDGSARGGRGWPLYGTTWEGGSPHYNDPSYGTVFRIRADTLQVERVHVFARQTGGSPHAGLVRGPGERLFGTTTSIPGGSGTVFGMTVAPEAGATATVTHLRTFTNEEEGNPMTELVWAPDGFLYGTALEA